MLLTLLSADAKSAVLLRVLSLTKVEVRNFPFIHFPRWLCLVHGPLFMSMQCVKRSVIFKYQCFCIFDIQKWSVLSRILESKSSFLRHRNCGVVSNCYVCILKFYSLPIKFSLLTSTDWRYRDVLKI